MLSLKDLKATEVVHLNQDHLIGLMRFWDEFTNTFHFIEEAHCLRIKSSLPHPLFNHVIKTNFPFDKQKSISTVIQDYKELQVPFLWRVWEHDTPQDREQFLLINGAQQMESIALMAIDLESFHPMSEPILDLKVRAVRNIEKANDFSNCYSAIFDIPKKLTPSITEIIIKQDQNIESYVGYFQDTPVSIGTIFYFNGVAGIYNVGTLKEYQGKGIGGEMMTTMLLKAKLDDLKTAILQGPADGIGIYEKLGFQFCGEMKQFLFLK